MSQFSFKSYEHLMVSYKITCNECSQSHKYLFNCCLHMYRGADKSLARPGRKQATATEDFEFHISYL